MVLVPKLVGTALVALQLPVAQVAPTVPTVPEEPTPVEAPAVPDADEIATATLLLSGYHGIPSAEEFEAALDDPRAVLSVIATDPGASPIHRDRAIGALAYWPNDALRVFYEELLAAPDTPEMVRHRVIGHLAVAFGDAAIETIAPYLDDTDVQFRMTAVHALGQIGTPAAFQRLEQAAIDEPSPIVLERIQQIRQFAR